MSLVRRGSSMPCSPTQQSEISAQTSPRATRVSTAAAAHHRMESTHWVILRQMPRRRHCRCTRILQRPTPRQAALEPGRVQTDCSHRRDHCAGMYRTVLTTESLLCGTPGQRVQDDGPQGQSGQGTEPTPRLRAQGLPRASSPPGTGTRNAGRY